MSDQSARPPEIAPFGSWRSPVGAGLAAEGVIPLGQVQLADSGLYWLEGRPTEGGRYVLVHHSPDGQVQQLTPDGFNVRTRVHEYGGGAYLVHQGTAYFSNFADQRLYRQDGPDQAPLPISPEPERPAAARYADFRITADGRWLFCVRELHPEEGEPVNELAVLPTDGSAPPRTVISGNDFYASPRLSPDGQRLAWLTWDHPRMPWDGSELWVGDLDVDGTVTAAHVVAGGPDESVFQPEWGPDGLLYFVSDRTGWWNLYRLNASGAIEALAPMDAEFGTPQWVFGLAMYAFLSGGRLACVYLKDGFAHLGLITPGRQQLQPLQVPYNALGGPRLVSDGANRLAFVGASPAEAAVVVTLDVAEGRTEVVRRSLERSVDPGYLSAPRPITYPTTGGQQAHALYYPPANRDFRGPEGDRSPLLVLSHGGPTSMATAALDLETQFWTSRGFGVVDVNYRGSSGYGRAYRQALNGQWGIADVDDCANAARYLVEQGEVDGRRLAIRGGSAGGYTTLCALTFRDDFAAGASYYGVADLEALATDTHKFESRYLDSLVGPYPEERDLYYDRSPVHFADHLSCPVILFQGLEDKVVPPAQAEAMAAALREKGLPFAYLAFEGEQHGFRKADTIRRTLEAELYFYGRLFGFTPADPIEPVEIENLDS